MGEEAYGPNWQQEWIDRPDAPERKLILQYMRAALQSGHVAVHWSTFTLGFESGGDLTPQEADREFFRIDLKNNCVFHHSMNQIVSCYIHEEQLRGFIMRQGRRTLPATDFDADKCLKWLIKEFSNPDYHPPKFEDHLQIAKNQFSRLSNRAFKNARKQAIQITERYDIAKAGRRKKSNQSAT